VCPALVLTLPRRNRSRKEDALVSNAHRFPYVVLAALAWVIAASGTAWAQLAAQNVYNGIDRPIPAEVTVPESAGGEVEIHLYEWGGQEPIAQAAAADGAVDLAALFPCCGRRSRPKCCSPSSS